MNAVEKIKQDLNPDLFVNMVTAHQRGGKNVVRFPAAPPRAHEEPEAPSEERPAKSDPTLFTSCLLAAFGLWCLVLACLV